VFRFTTTSPISPVLQGLFGRGRTGDASVQDSKYVDNRAAQIERNLGDSVQRVRDYDREGKAIRRATKNINGRLVKSNEDGFFTVVDEGVLDYHLELDDQVQETVDRVMKA
jgi:hypothetical protein